MAKLPTLPFIRSAVTQGQSANAAYREYVQTAHEQDLTGIRRQDFLRLYSETRAARGRTADAIAAPRTSLPSPDLISPMTGMQSKYQYGSWVMVYQRTKGESDLIASPWMIGSDEPLTPEEAERRVGAAIAQGEHEYPRTTLGIGYVGTVQFG